MNNTTVPPIKIDKRTEKILSHMLSISPTFYVNAGNRINALMKNNIFCTAMVDTTFPVDFYISSPEFITGMNLFHYDADFHFDEEGLFVDITHKNTRKRILFGRKLCYDKTYPPIVDECLLIAEDDSNFIAKFVLNSISLEHLKEQLKHTITTSQVKDELKRLNIIGVNNSIEFIIEDIDRSGNSRDTVPLYSTFNHALSPKEDLVEFNPEYNINFAILKNIFEKKLYQGNYEIHFLKYGNYYYLKFINLSDSIKYIMYLGTMDNELKIWDKE